MKIDRLVMEDWLADNQFARYNLAESGTEDFTVGEFLEACGEPLENLNRISLINPDSRGSAELRDEIRKCYERVSDENILVTVGVSEALFVFFNHILDAGDEVIIGVPAFQPLYQLPMAIGCNMKFVNLLECVGFIPDPAMIADAITPMTRLIIINTPHNPTGSTVTGDTLQAIARIVQERDIFLLFDEHYKFLPLEEGTRLLDSGFDLCRDIHPKLAATGSVTKCFGLNGLRVGWLIADRGVIDGCRDYKDYLTHVTPPINDYLAAIALKNKGRLLIRKKQVILENLRRLNRFMGKNSSVFDYTPPGGGVVCFPGLKGTADAAGFCSELLNRHQVSLLPGSAFGKGMESHFRLNFGISSQPFAEALEAVQSFIGK
jgi:aspartate/methionine/tyrosine aminotransferase